MCVSGTGQKPEEKDFSHSFYFTRLNIINIHLYPSTFNSKVKNWKDQKTDYFLIIFLLREG